MALMLPAPVALGGALQPDLRHWKRVPAVQRQQAPEGLPWIRGWRNRDILLFRLGVVRHNVRTSNDRIPIFLMLCSGVTEVALYCTHRATTAFSWGLCEQEERSACSLASFW